MSDQDPRGIQFPRFFNAEDLGRSLKEVSTDFIATAEGRIVSRWFHSAKDADLYIWQDRERNVIKQQVSFYGQVVEWNLLEGVKTGVLVEFESEGHVAQAEIIRFDREAQRAPVDQAVELLRHVEGLAAADLEALTDNFVRPVTAQKMDPDEFVRRFGQFLKEPPKPRAGGAGAFTRVLKWVRGLFR